MARYGSGSLAIRARRLTTARRCDPWQLRSPEPCLQQRTQVDLLGGRQRLLWRVRRVHLDLQRDAIHVRAHAAIDESRQLVDRVVDAAAGRIDVQRIYDREM